MLGPLDLGSMFFSQKIIGLSMLLLRMVDLNLDHMKMFNQELVIDPPNMLEQSSGIKIQ